MEALPARSQGLRTAKFGNASSLARARPLIETKLFFLTSEFLLLVAALVGLGITTLVSDSVAAPLFWAITTALVAAYAVSRGSAKAGSEHRRSRTTKSQPRRGNDADRQAADHPDAPRAWRPRQGAA